GVDQVRRDARGRRDAGRAGRDSRRARVGGVDDGGRAGRVERARTTGIRPPARAARDDRAAARAVAAGAVHGDERRLGGRRGGRRDDGAGRHGTVRRARHARRRLMFVLGNLIGAVATVLDVVLNALGIILIVNALLSWVRPDPANPIV